MQTLPYAQPIVTVGLCLPGVENKAGVYSFLFCCICLSQSLLMHKRLATPAGPGMGPQGGTKELWEHALHSPELLAHHLSSPDTLRNLSSPLRILGTSSTMGRSGLWHRGRADANLNQGGNGKSGETYQTENIFLRQRWERKCQVWHEEP